MISVIFGAGASYDSIFVKRSDSILQTLQNDSTKPPLSNQLFETNRVSEIIDKGGYPKQKPLYDIEGICYALNAAVQQGESLEEVLEDYAKSADCWKEIVGVKFYLRDFFLRVSRKHFQNHEQSNNYATLLHYISRVLKKDINIITFNYDTLIEIALRSRLGVKFDKISDYYESDSIKLLKMHGSANWGRKITELRYGDSAYEYIVSKKEFTAASPIQICDSTLDNFPSICVPMTRKNKDSFDCPPEMLTACNDVISKTKKLLIIGWKGQENHFNEEYLTKIGPTTEIIIVTDNTENSKLIYERNLKQYLRSEKITFLGKGFSGFIAHDMRSL